MFAFIFILFYFGCFIVKFFESFLPYLLLVLGRGHSSDNIVACHSLGIYLRSQALATENDMTTYQIPAVTYLIKLTPSSFHLFQHLHLGGQPESRGERM
jgi:hypothetical protein